MLKISKVDIVSTEFVIGKEFKDAHYNVWILTNGNDWYMDRVSIASPYSYQLVFEAVRGNDYHGDIAIDDISVIDGLCDKPICPIGMSFGELCYNVEQVRKSYEDATAYCQMTGGLLAAPKTQSQQNFIKKLLSDEINKYNKFWIGLNDRQTEGRFMYSDGLPLPTSRRSFHSWAAGEPNDSQGDEDCVNLEIAFKNRHWNDAVCDEELWFICQYPIVT